MAGCGVSALHPALRRPRAPFRRGEQADRLHLPRPEPATGGGREGQAHDRYRRDPTRHHHVRQYLRGSGRSRSCRWEYRDGLIAALLPSVDAGLSVDVGRAGRQNTPGRRRTRESARDGVAVFLAGRIRMPKLYEALAEAFLAEGVDTQFVLMGDGNMHWSTAFAKLPGVHTVHVRHEHSTVAAATAYNVATGKVAVASVTCGPGVTQLMTALPAAVRARLPMVVFAGEPPINAKSNPAGQTRLTHDREGQPRAGTKGGAAPRLINHGGSF